MFTWTVCIDFCLSRTFRVFAFSWWKVCWRMGENIKIILLLFLLISVCHAGKFISHIIFNLLFWIRGNSRWWAWKLQLTSIYNIIYCLLNTIRFCKLILAPVLFVNSVRLGETQIYLHIRLRHWTPDVPWLAKCFKVGSTVRRHCGVTFINKHLHVGHYTQCIQYNCHCMIQVTRVKVNNENWPL